MFLGHFLFSLFIAFVLVLIFRKGFRKDRPIAEFGVFFLVLLLLTWAGGIYISPFGPEYRGVRFAPFILAGLFFALLLVAVLTPRRRPRNIKNLEEADRDRAEEALALTGLLWILLVGISILIAVRYLV
jgi:Ca2+/Na+ antiporter